MTTDKNFTAFIKTYVLILWFVWLSLTAITPSFATEILSIYVSPEGNNQNSGSFDSPFKTIQYGLNRLQPGQTLYLKSGIYREKLVWTKSGTNTKPLQLKAAPNAKPIIDGLDIKGNALDGDALIDLNGQNHIRIEGIELRNNIDRAFPMGIFVDEDARNIEISNNIIHNINTNRSPETKEHGGASAILVVGTHPTKAITDINIEGNLVYDCELGVSEAISVSKNVDGFKIKNNIVRDVANIGIVVAGFHGTFTGDPNLNQARNGSIIGNTVSGARSKYGTGDASGIYIDGAKNIIVTDNKVFENDNGLTVGCEIQNRMASNITLSNNLIWNNDKSGLSIGGWSDAAGRVTNVKAVRNLSYKNNVLAYPFHAEFNLKLTSGLIEIHDNIFYSRQTKAIDFSNDTSIYPLLYNLSGNDKLSMLRNLWYADVAPSEAYFRYDDKGYLGIQNLIASTGLEPYGYFVKPKFIDADQHNFQSSTGSPASDFGPYGSNLSFSRFKADAKLSEWYPVSDQSLVSMPNTASPAIKAEFDSRSLWFGIKKGSSQAKTQIFLDVDQNAKSGYNHYKITNLGAEYLIEDNTLYRYEGTGNNWVWVKICQLNYADAALTKELQLPFSHLLLSPPQTIRFAYLEKSTTTNKYEQPIIVYIRVYL